MIDGFSVLVMEMRRGNVVVMLMRSKGRDVCTVCNGILFSRIGWFLLLCFLLGERNIITGGHVLGRGYLIELLTGHKLLYKHLIRW